MNPLGSLSVSATQPRSQNFSFVPLNPAVTKINAIKLIREFTSAAFGQACSLKEAKEFVDSVVLNSATYKKALDQSNAVRAMLLTFPAIQRVSVFDALVSNNDLKEFKGLSRWNLDDTSLAQVIV